MTCKWLTTLGLATTLVAGAIGTASVAEATPAEENFYRDISQYAHPAVDESFLLFLGDQACQVRKSGQDTNAAKRAVYTIVENAKGVTSNTAEVGSLVHVAIDNLCPEVGYP
jgi:hypothetical protein